MQELKMIYKLPEEKVELVKPLFKKMQPNFSSLGQYFMGDRPGQTFVDNLVKPTRAISVISWDWTYISDAADFEWIENALLEISKTTFMQVIWNLAERPQRPSCIKGITPRYEFTERNKISAHPVDVEIKPIDKQNIEKCEWKGMMEWKYGNINLFFEKGIGFVAVQGDKICSEAYSCNGDGTYAEMGVITAMDKKRQGFGFAACLKVLEELEKRGLKPTWSCDRDNEGSKNLAKKLGFINPTPYEFLWIPKQDS